MADEQNEAHQDDNEDVDEQEQSNVTGSNNGRVQDENVENPNDDEEEDPLKDYEAAILARERERIRKEEQDRLAKERADEQAELQRQAAVAAAKEKLNDSLKNHTKRVREAVEKLPIRDELGDPLKLTDAQLQEFIQPLIDLNGEVQQTMGTTAEQVVYQRLANAALEVIPAEKHEEFAKKAGDKPLKDYLQTIVELNAPNTEYAKTLQADFDVKLKAAYARGFARGQKAPPGTPTTPEQRDVNRGETVDTTSLAGAARALSRNLITEAEFLEIRKKLRG